MWWKKNPRKILIPVLAAAVLAGAFWYGGSAPGMRGWPAEPDETVTAEPAPTGSTVPSPDRTAQTAPDPTAAPTPDPTADPGTGSRPGGAPEGTAAQEQPEAGTQIAGAAEGEPSDPDGQGTVLDPATGKDRYLTEPVPEGRPLPVEPQDVTVSDTAYTCTISISCAAILDNMDWLDPEKAELVPEDGWILSPTQVTFYEGESVFNVLQRTCKQMKIHMEFENTPIYNSAYIEGIGNLYEFDCGELSGWMYQVNDWFPNYGCSRYQLREGDVICWVYTCDLGADAGGYYAAHR